MSDFDSADISSSSARYTEALNKELGEVLGQQFERTAKVGEREREGLPPSYRMRADAHYVEQLMSRSPGMSLQSVAIDEIETDGVVQIEGLQPLAQSIAAHGVLQPLLVRSEGDTYRLIAGRRRLAAARMARLSRVPCLIHQVDDQEAQALTRAANIRAREEAAPASAPARDAGADVLNDLSAVVASMQSAAAMLAGRGTAIGQRVALDLLQAEARRADWQLRAAAIVGNRHPWQPRRVVLGPIVIRVCESFAAEARLNGIELRPEIPDWNVATSVDEDALACAISGALLATLALAEPSDARTITLALRTSADGSPVVDVTQSAATLPAGGAGRFFDLSWTERPGGWTAALGAATAKAVAERTGGSGILIARDGRGSAIRLTFGR